MYDLTPIGKLSNFGYWGDHPDWPVAHGWAEAASDAQRTLDQSNTFAMIKRFEVAGCAVNDCYTLENFGGAFGQGTYLVVRPGSNAERIARECLTQIEDYPALDEDDWSEREEENRFESLIGWAKSEYPSLDPETLASYTLSAYADASREIGDDMTGWPHADREDERTLIARALRQARTLSRSHAA